MVREIFYGPKSELPIKTPSAQSLDKRALFCYPRALNFPALSQRPGFLLSYPPPIPMQG
jgi:hypothetical protein